MPDTPRRPRRIAAVFLLISGVGLVVAGLYFVTVGERALLGGVIFAAGTFDLLAALYFAKG